ncbi:S-layer homology domain [Desulfocucumis palustris]|uniref:S-layer homology domain n=1 Tax=Desulfocucumis palustris TaxID=1898651 RepID=A0A2L2XHB3_9FIRM|nr:S-layer homology domain-containing protein [Desulfocucumis palustris]GBF35540.1 S-layer homology domain [Desulfocucumis palustris]
MLSNKKMISQIAMLALIIPTLLLCRFSPAMAATASSTPIYTDLQNHWAQSRITRLATLGWLGLFRGQEMYPDQAANKLEALALTMKAAGFTPAPVNSSAAGKKTVKPAAAAKNMNIPAWGRRYFELAVEKGFVPDQAQEAFAPEKPVTRLDLAKILARTLYLTPPLNASSLTAESPNTTPSPAFTDGYLIPAEDLPLLQAVVDAGIMAVYQDGTFAPYGTVTRAELVSIISRLIDLGWIKISNGQQFTGRIAKIATTGKTRELELVTLSGSKKYKLSGRVLCYKDGTAWPVSLSAGYRSEIILDSKKTVGWINLLEKSTTAANPEKIRGSIKSIVLGNTNYLIINDLFCRDHMLPLAWDLVIDGKKASQNVKNLKNDSFVDIEVDGGQVKKITLLDTKTKSDTVVKAGDGTLYLKSKVSKNKPGWLNHWDLARIVDLDGNPRSDILPNDKVEITYLDPFPDEIDDEIPLEIKITTKKK